MTVIVICERCHKKQPNRTAQLDRPEDHAIGCIRCGHPYGRYAKEKK